MSVSLDQLMLSIMSNFSVSEEYQIVQTCFDLADKQYGEYKSDVLTTGHTVPLLKNI